MIIVNTPGDYGKTFAPLLHANWHGFTFTDLVFPSFLFAVGTSLAFVQLKWSKLSVSSISIKILKRTFIIFILGYIMYWFPFMKWTPDGDLVMKGIGETRIWGVLQRIAVCYGITAFMVLFLNKKQLIFSAIALLLGYWALLYGFGDYSLENNAVRQLDLFLFGADHLYGGDGIPFDPEGLLSTFPAVVNTIGGYLAGRYIMDNSVSHYEKITKILLIAGGLMVVSHFWDFLFPINKKLWTSSYVLLTVGLDLSIVAALIYAIDIRIQSLNFRFFEIFGKNPLILYLLSEYLLISLLFIRVNGEESLFSWIYENGFTWLPAYWSSFIFALLYILVCWSVGWWMDKQKIYIRV
jgi:predicted acyltransferase